MLSENNVRKCQISLMISNLVLCDSGYLNQAELLFIPFTVQTFIAVNRSRTLMNLYDAKPTLGRDVFVAPSAAVIGDVKLGNNASVFYGSVLRGKEASSCRFHACFNALNRILNCCFMACRR